MTTGRINQIAFDKRKYTDKHTRGRREEPPLSHGSRHTLAPIRSDHRRSTNVHALAFRATPATPRGAAQAGARNAKLPAAGPGSTGASGTWTKPAVERPYCGQCIRAPTRYHSDMLRRIVTKGPKPEKETASLVPPRRPAT